MALDPNENPVPMVVIKCIEYIEIYGMQSVGLYRLSGSGTQIQKIRMALSRGIIVLLNFQQFQPFIFRCRELSIRRHDYRCTCRHWCHETLF